MKRSRRIVCIWISSFLIAALAFSPVFSARALADDPSASPASGTTAQGNGAIKQIGGGKGFTVVLKADGTVWSWGDNVRGKLGGGLDSRDKPSQVKGVSDIASIAVGGFHTLALKKDGTVWAWGQNTSGQLGDGSTTDRFTPVQVSGLSGVVAISAGSYHSVALKSDGSIMSWGDDYYGQLGDGGAERQSHPVPVKTLQDAKSIAAGANHTVAIDSKGYVWGWGDNYAGELGNGNDKTTSSTPYMANNYFHATQIAAGYQFTLVLADDGRVWSMGDNSSGQLGTGGDATAQKSPTMMPFVENVTAISAGYSHAMLIDKDGTVRTWGDNSSGQVGSGQGFDGKLFNGIYAQILTGLPKSSLISAGYNFSFALDNDGKLWAWGNNTFGQLGNGTKTDQIVPVQNTSLAEASKPTLPPGSGPIVNGAVQSSGLAAGEATNLAVKAGRLFSWGDNLFGQMGNGANNASLTPAAISSLADVSAVSVGGAHSAAVKTDGTLWTWGFNYYGQLGNGTTTNSNSPGQVVSLKGNVVSVATGANHTVALLNNGTVWTFGDNTYGQLATDDYISNSQPTPAIVPSLDHITAIAAGGNFTLALKDDGNVWAWGDNVNGQLGDGTNVSKKQPVQVANLKDIKAIAAGKNHALALKRDGTVWTWGYNAFGQLGNGNTNSQNTPSLIAILNDGVSIAAGSYHSLVIRSNGTVWSWGYNNFGQLGEGTTANQTSPIQIKGIPQASSVAAGSSHSIAVAKDGTVWTWGADFSGQLGDGARVNRSAAAMVTGFAPVFSDIADHWAKSAIMQAAEKGYVEGYSDGTYQPDRNMTRAEFVKMLAASLHVKAAAPADGQPWYQPYADAMAKKGILQTGDLSGDWNEPITRAEMALLSIRAADGQLQQPNKAVTPQLAMSESVKAGLIQGLANGELAPEGFTTRAQSVTIIERVAAVLQGVHLPVDQ